MADITRPIEPFELTQGFGGNAAAYARFGLKGHNGWDLKTKFPDTPEGKRNILASYNSTFYAKANEGNDGYGLYFEVIVKLFKTYKLTYGHCHSVQSFNTKKESEPMAISDNTGNSTGAHLHLTVKQGNLVNGKFVNDNQNNGFFGAINPQIFFDELREFKKQQGGSVDEYSRSAELDRFYDFLAFMAPNDYKGSNKAAWVKQKVESQVPIRQIHAEVGEYFREKLAQPAVTVTVDTSAEIKSHLKALIDYATK